MNDNYNGHKCSINNFNLNKIVKTFLSNSCSKFFSLFGHFYDVTYDAIYCQSIMLLHYLAIQSEIFIIIYNTDQTDLAQHYH